MAKQICYNNWELDMLVEWLIWWSITIWINYVGVLTHLHLHLHPLYVRGLRIDDNLVMF